MDKTLKYYAENAAAFVQGTVSVDFSETQGRFLSKLNAGASILDFGCGSGRDTKYFLDNGYSVTAIDGSEELCELASEYTGIKVHHMLFQELSDVNQYDGIWACASILHLKKTEIGIVLRKMIDALKENGVIYTSFKYGKYEGERNGRYFTDMTEETFLELIAEMVEIQVLEMWKTSDVRPGRGEEQWLNIVLRKTTI